MARKPIGPTHAEVKAKLLRDPEVRREYQTLLPADRTAQLRQKRGPTQEQPAQPCSMRIVDLHPDDEATIRQVAALLVEGFRGVSAAWPDLTAGLDEVRATLAPGRISRVALAEEGAVLGWIGGKPEYGGNVWELHPLVVHPAHRRKGIGRALVADLEGEVARRGGHTLWLGTDDEDRRTSLGGVDLYPDPLAHLARIRNLAGHPYEFYLKVGFVLAGVVPDANGPGKPDILMARRVARK